MAAEIVVECVEIVNNWNSIGYNSISNSGHVCGSVHYTSYVNSNSNSVSNNNYNAPNGSKIVVQYAYIWNIVYILIFFIIV